MDKVVLVACVGKKLDHAAPAARLYQSPWFHKARRYAELVADRWWILSAGHGLVAPDEMLAPYDETLRRMPVDRRRQWTREVVEQLAPLTDPARDEIIILAGRAYREFLMMWLADFLGYTVSVPLEGLGIGRQLQWLNQSIADLTGKDVS